MLLAILIPGFMIHGARADDDAAAAAAADLKQVVVSATRTAQPLDKTGSSMSVISGAELDQRQTLFVTDILAQTPGLTASRNGGPGQSTSLYIRGAEPGESLVLIDGIRINDPSAPDGEAILGDLLSNDIDRIEVLRGPQSTLYGSDAIGGVINILTQRGGTGPLSLRVEAQGGTFDTQRYNAALNGTEGAVEYSGAANYYDTRGISAADARNGNTEPDGYRNLGVTANLRLHATEQISLDLRGFYLRSHTDIDGYPPPDYRFRDTPEFGENYLRAGYAAVNASLFAGHLSQRVAVLASDSDRRFFGVFDPISLGYSPAENFYASGGATRIEYQGVVEFNAANELTYGAERQLSTLTTDSLPDVGSGPTTGRDRVTGYYAEWQSTLARQLTLTGGVRYDDDQEFGSHTTAKIAGAWQLLQGATILRANYGGGFKAPTLYQLFSPYSNPTQTLKPESSDGWELGADQLLLARQLRASLTYFDRHEQNAIDFFDCFGELVPVAACLLRRAVGGYYYNVGRSRSSGYEAEIVARPGDAFNAWANYTSLRAIDQITGRELARRPRVSANVGLNWTARPGTALGASLSYVGARFDDAANALPLASATTVNVFASYALFDTAAAVRPHREPVRQPERTGVRIRRGHPRLLCRAARHAVDAARCSRVACMGHRLSKIVTRTGDDGTTGLGDGTRVSKNALRVEAMGSVDELNCALGVVAADALPIAGAGDCLIEIQHDLFDLGGELAIPGSRLIEPARVAWLEAQAEQFNSALPPLKEFVLPGGGAAAAACHVARAICRRAERRCWALARAEPVGDSSLHYLNRLSDLLFVLARVLARAHGGNEPQWQRRARTRLRSGRLRPAALVAAASRTPAPGRSCGPARCRCAPPGARVLSVG